MKNYFLQSITISWIDYYFFAINETKISTFINVILSMPFRIYVVGMVFEWIKRNGGVEGMQNLAKKKSGKIYDVISKSGGFYKCPIRSDTRSKMNIPFRIKNGDEELEKEFLSGASARGMLQLKGHRSVLDNNFNCAFTALVV